MQQYTTSSSPNPQQPGAQQQNNSQFYYALKAYFYSQGQSIFKLKAQLDSNSVAHGFRYTISVLLELLMYIVAVIGLVFSLMMPANPLEISHEFNNGDQFSAEYQNEDLMAAILLIKIILVFVAVLPAVFCGILLHRNRNKSSKIRKAYEEVSLMKTNFDKAIRDFNL